MMLNRREFLATSSLFLAGCAAAPAPAARRPRILLRSSWQTVNIGDIAHTPGMLRLLSDRFPQADLTLWPNALSADVESMLRRRFPALRIARTAEEQREAVATCDFFLHGSGPGLVGAAAAKTWQATGKPYGIGGITLRDDEIRANRDLLAGATFIFCRDTQSLDALKAARLPGPVQDFGPDATFALDLRNDARADSFLRDNGLEPEKFACFVPRLRWTPYWKEGRKVPPEMVQARQAENDRHVEADHAKLRSAIVAWVRETGHRALLCPEMTYQVELLRPLLFDPLPADVKAETVVRSSYWLTDEAASTYRHAAAIVSLEMHSPIIAIANGRPAIHLRQPTDTRKGQMWRDVGLQDWLFEIDAASGDAIAERLVALHRSGPETRRSVEKAQEITAGRFKTMMDAVAAAL